MFGAACLVLVFDVWCLVFGVWYVVYGVWCWAFGAWRLAFGVWCLVWVWGVLLEGLPSARVVQRVNRLVDVRIPAVQEARYKATWKREFNTPWHKASLPESSR